MSCLGHTIHSVRTEILIVFFLNSYFSRSVLNWGDILIGKLDLLLIGLLQDLLDLSAESFAGGFSTLQLLLLNRLHSSEKPLSALLYLVLHISDLSSKRLCQTVASLVFYLIHIRIDSRHTLNTFDFANLRLLCLSYDRASRATIPLHIAEVDHCLALDE